MISHKSAQTFLSFSGKIWVCTQAREINAVMKERTVTALGFYLSRGKLQLHQTSILQYKSLFIAILSLTENTLKLFIKNNYKY